ncbi:MAG: TadE/TadG family type IV pilus assembly protein, partial [Gaiella sp.]
PPATQQYHTIFREELKVIRRNDRNEEGQAMVEFALIIPALLLVVFGIIQFGILFNNYLTLTDAVRVGARQAAVSRQSPNPIATTTDQIMRAADHLDTSQLEITITPGSPSDWTQGGDIQVTATYPYSISLLGLVVKSGRLTSTTTERME